MWWLGSLRGPTWRQALLNFPLANRLNNISHSRFRQTFETEKILPPKFKKRFTHHAFREQPFPPSLLNSAHTFFPRRGAVISPSYSFPLRQTKWANEQVIFICKTVTSFLRSKRWRNNNHVLQMLFKWSCKGAMLFYFFKHILLKRAILDLFSFFSNN